MMSTAHPLTLLGGLVVALGIAAVVGLIVTGHVVVLGLGVAAVAYGLVVWNTRRMAEFEASVENDDSYE
jgi:hypothetical protein